MQFITKVIHCIVFLFFIAFGCAYALVLNNPYPKSEANEKIYYSSFAEQPKTLDPARSYTSNEYVFINQIYEPVLQYDYLKRPYQLVPLNAVKMPALQYLDEHKKPISRDANIAPAYSVYRVEIKKGILYQPHPAFAMNHNGHYYYDHLSDGFLDEHHINQLSDFKYLGTRELKSDDYIYQIKRLAKPSVSSPISGLMGEYIVGFKEFTDSFPQTELGKNHFTDLRKYPLEGVKKIDDYTFEIMLKGQYPQFLYWLAMPFFSPVPWEADLFYSQKGMSDRNITFDWYPVGTGPFMLVKNNPNRSIIMQKNPNFHEEYYPFGGTEEDIKSGYLNNAGKKLPLVDKVTYTLEKEFIPRWNKFLQGYYDNSNISADSFEQAIHINRFGDAVISPEIAKKKIYLTQTLEPYINYLGFNMLDKVVGGNSERARKLRQAISIAVNFDEKISIFYNGRGVPAHGPLPPGIFGYKEGAEGMNPYVYEIKDNKIQRHSLDYAKKLMIEAGYPGGIDPATGKALILHYDVTETGGSEDKPMMDWMRKQFAKIGIDLNVRGTLYNRFQEKMRTGNAQIYSWGWSADYPDPENFLFQLYSKNGKVKFGGENSSNYANPEYDRLFDLMKNRPNDAQRQQLIDQMLEIVRHDAPWAWGFHPIHFDLSQTWTSPVKPNLISSNTLKYLSINVSERNKLRILWNQPVIWPLGLLFGLVLLLVLPLVFAYIRQEKLQAKRIFLK